MTVDARDVYRRWINDLWSRGAEDAEALIDELVSEDFVGHWPDREIKGRRALAKVIDETHDGFDDLTFVITIGPIVDGAHIAGRWAGEGQNAEGPVTFFGNDILRLDHDVIVEYWTAAMYDTSAKSKKKDESA